MALKDVINNISEETKETNEMVVLPERELALLEELKNLELQYKEIDKKRDEIKQSLLVAMEENNIKKWENDLFTISYVGESVRKSVDSKKLSTDYPHIYEQVIKESKVKPSIRIKLK